MERVTDPCASRKTIPAVAATPFASTVTPVMFTVTGFVFWPRIAMITPRPSRRFGWAAAICFAPTWRGSIVTWSAPAPLRVRSLLIVRTLVPGVPGPSAYVPGQIEIVSPACAARIALRIRRKSGAGQVSLCLPTVRVDGAFVALPAVGLVSFGPGFACFGVCAAADNVGSANAATSATSSLRPILLSPRERPRTTRSTPRLRGV